MDGSERFRPVNGAEYAYSPSPLDWRAPGI
jgi:hypothetical protein